MADAEGPGQVTVLAPAKINLYLHVTGRRDDGYHTLDSLVAFAGVTDVVELTETDGADVTLTLEGPFADALSAGPENLALRAARWLAETTGAGAGVHIRLEKRLPVAAGIGGGSADAAAVLHGLARLWRLDIAMLGFDAVARALGADVPVCLRGEAAFVGGIGETIEPAPALVPAWLVLANPGVPLSTPDVFAGRKGPFSAAERFDGLPGDIEALAALLAARRNDLTDAAVALRPVVGEVLAALDAADECLLARMSGSGATCFGLFADATDAHRTAAVIGQGHPDWWVHAAPLLTDWAALGA